MNLRMHTYSIQHALDLLVKERRVEGGKGGEKLEADDRSVKGGGEEKEGRKEVHGEGGGR